MTNNYDSWAQFFETIDFTFYRSSKIQSKYIDVILEQIKNIAQPKLLEIAGGSGYTSIIIADLLKRKEAEVNYSDLSSVVVNKVSQTFNNFKVNFLVQDSNKITLPNKSMDIIFHQGFLEHFDDDQIINFLKEQARVATFVIFDVPNSRRQNKTQEFGNERFLSHKKWQELVKAANLYIYKSTARRFTNSWKKFIPFIILQSDWFHRNFGESTIIVCGE
jgi:ubiquinone/menaquinone biosynthesis C-methylase UbiE